MEDCKFVPSLYLQNACANVPPTLSEVDRSGERHGTEEPPPCHHGSPCSCVPHPISPNGTVYQGRTVVGNCDKI